MDLQKIAQEQQVKLEKEREEIKEQIKAVKEAAPPPESPPVPPAPAPSKAQAVSAPTAAKEPEQSKNTDHKGKEKPIINPNTFTFIKTNTNLVIKTVSPKMIIYSFIRVCCDFFLIFSFCDI